MEPIPFSAQTQVLAENQKEYLPLPVHYDRTDPQGTMISCWKLTWKERFKVLFMGIIWLRQLTFHTPLQPQAPTVDYPFRITEDGGE